MYGLIFDSEQDAIAIENQMYGFSRLKNLLVSKTIDYNALNLAISLAGVERPVISQSSASPLKSRLPYPEHERECTDENTPKIYVACLSAYNSGHLHGLWIDATQDPEDIQDDINWMLSWSPMSDDETCEEWAIHDYENFHEFSLGENKSLDYVSKLAQALDNASDSAAMAAWLNYAKDPVNDPDIEELAEEFSSYYCGHWESETDFVLKSEEMQNMFNWSEFEKQFKFWSQHIDWDSVARELFIEGYDSVKAHPSGVYVFREYYG
ncbi:antirestriction protein ArdA [Anabaena sp. UHCC 0451]|uniref:antirestriction protein ArdA n=1 Tax=Anabaena sp. UHCC 0451 TaxID=2055235 RepID=UPI002B1F353F|nr:antirestriction protein ArdA [Anabaena sp. UHCC 0451]MEA5578636.1 antirestriction protein ArdA [Anabaena sp. UHCC 0451]